MLNAHQTLADLHQKLGNIDLAKVKNSVKKRVNFPVSRSLASIILDDVSTLLALASSPYNFETNDLARVFMEQEGPVRGILKHNALVSFPVLHSYPCSYRPLEEIFSKRIEDPSVVIYRKNLPSDIILDFICFPKYVAGIHNLNLFINNLHLSEPWNSIIRFGTITDLILSYAYSFYKHYSGKIDNGVLKEDLKFAGKKLFGRYKRIGYRLVDKFPDKVKEIIWPFSL